MPARKRTATNDSKTSSPAATSKKPLSNNNDNNQGIINDSGDVNQINNSTVNIQQNSCPELENYSLLINPPSTRNINNTFNETLEQFTTLGEINESPAGPESPSVENEILLPISPSDQPSIGSLSAAATNVSISYNISKDSQNFAPSYTIRETTIQEEPALTISPLEVYSPELIPKAKEKRSTRQSEEAYSKQLSQEALKTPATSNANIDKSVCIRTPAKNRTANLSLKNHLLQRNSPIPATNHGQNLTETHFVLAMGERNSSTRSSKKSGLRYVGTYHDGDDIDEYTETDDAEDSSMLTEEDQEEGTDESEYDAAPKQKRTRVSSQDPDGILPNKKGTTKGRKETTGKPYNRKSTVGMTAEQIQERRLERRRERNRLAARRSRERRLEYIDELEGKNANLVDKINELEKKNAALIKEIQQLKKFSSIQTKENLNDDDVLPLTREGSVVAAHTRSKTRKGTFAQ